jgi:CheY-like chemotaxis protein
VLPAASVQKLSVRPPLRAKRTPGTSAVVLVVDDEQSVGIALRRVLRDHDVTVATSAKEALEILASGKTFDVVFSDLMMPEMSGMDMSYEVALRFPAMAERIIFITGGAFTRGVRAFLECMPNMRPEKPFDPKTVRALVGECKKVSTRSTTGSPRTRLPLSRWTGKTRGRRAITDGSWGHSLEVSRLGVRDAPYVFYLHAVGQRSIVNHLAGPTDMNRKSRHARCKRARQSLARTSQFRLRPRVLSRTPVLTPSHEVFVCPTPLAK